MDCNKRDKRDARKLPQLTNDDLPNIVNYVMFDSLEDKPFDSTITPQKIKITLRGSYMCLSQERLSRIKTFDMSSTNRAHFMKQISYPNL